MNDVERHNAFFPLNASICVKNHWLSKSIISAGNHLPPPIFPPSAHIPSREGKLCLLRWVVAAKGLHVVFYF